MKLIPQGLLPRTRTLRELFPNIVIDCNRPPKDEPICDIMAREGAHIGGVSTTDWAKGKTEWEWLMRRRGRHTTSKGDGDGTPDEA